MNRFPVVLGCVPSAAAVIVIAMVQVPLGANVMLLNEAEVAPIVSAAGAGEHDSWCNPLWCWQPAFRRASRWYLRN